MSIWLWILLLVVLSLIATVFACSLCKGGNQDRGIETLDWIHPKDKLPESDDVMCIVYARDDYEFAWWYESAGAWDSPDIGWIDAEEVEWWLPISEIPKNTPG